MELIWRPVPAKPKCQLSTKSLQAYQLCVASNLCSPAMSTEWINRKDSLWCRWKWLDSIGRTNTFAVMCGVNRFSISAKCRRNFWQLCHCGQPIDRTVWTTRTCRDTDWSQSMPANICWPFRSIYLRWLISRHQSGTATECGRRTNIMPAQFCLASASDAAWDFCGGYFSGPHAEDLCICRNEALKIESNFEMIHCVCSVDISGALTFSEWTQQKLQSLESINELCRPCSISYAIPCGSACILNQSTNLKLGYEF